MCSLNEYEVLLGSWPWSGPWVPSKDVFSPVVRLLWSELCVCKVVAFSSKQETPRESKMCRYKPCESPRSTYWPHVSGAGRTKVNIGRRCHVRN